MVPKYGSKCSPSLPMKKFTLEMYNGFYKDSYLIKILKYIPKS